MRGDDGSVRIPASAWATSDCVKTGGRFSVGTATTSDPESFERHRHRHRFDLDATFRRTESHLRARTQVGRFADRLGYDQSTGAINGCVHGDGSTGGFTGSQAMLRDQFDSGGDKPRPYGMP